MRILDPSAAHLQRSDQLPQIATSVEIPRPDEVERIPRRLSGARALVTGIPWDSNRRYPQ